MFARHEAGFLRRALAAAMTGAAAVAAMALGVGATVAEAHPTMYGINMPWLNYGSSFGTDGLHGWTTSYNGSTVQGYFNDMKSKHFNICRIWLNEDFDGLSFSGNNPNNAVTGISSQFLSNLQDFVSRANGDGICVYCTFLTFGDVTNYPHIVTTYKSNYIDNAMVPIVKALNGKWVQYDLCNEVNLTSGVSWTNLRAYASAAISAIHGAGSSSWITMTGQNPSQFTNSSTFNSTFGGLGFDFYDCHCYSTSSNPLQVYPSNVGNKPLFVGEFGPTSGWDDYSTSTDQGYVDNFANAANSDGYYGALAWCYLNDGSGYQLEGTDTIWTLEYYGNEWGIN
jgi:hypothetical protein